MKLFCPKCSNEISVSIVPDSRGFVGCPHCRSQVFHNDLIVEPNDYKRRTEIRTQPNRTG